MLESIFYFSREGAEMEVVVEVEVVKVEVVVELEVVELVKVQ